MRIIFHFSFSDLLCSCFSLFLRFSWTIIEKSKPDTLVLSMFSFPFFSSFFSSNNLIFFRTLNVYFMFSFHLYFFFFFSYLFLFCRFLLFFLTKNLFSLELLTFYFMFFQMVKIIQLQIQIQKYSDLKKHLFKVQIHYNIVFFIVLKEIFKR